MNEENNKKSSRERIKTDWKLLDALIVWASQEYCAEQLGMSADVLLKRIKEKYGMGWVEYRHKRREPLRINLLKKQYDVAMKGNVTMLIWLGKQMLEQKDSMNVEGEMKVKTWVELVKNLSKK